MLSIGIGIKTDYTRTSRARHGGAAGRGMENRDCMKSHVELSKPDLNCANNQFQNHKKFQCSTPNISEVMVDLRFPIVIHKGKVACLSQRKSTWGGMIPSEDSMGTVFHV